jgi:hypothetical protein
MEAHSFASLTQHPWVTFNFMMQKKKKKKKKILEVLFCLAQ